MQVNMEIIKLKPMIKTWLMQQLIKYLVNDCYDDHITAFSNGYRDEEQVKAVMKDETYVTLWRCHHTFAFSLLSIADLTVGDPGARTDMVFKRLLTLLFNTVKLSETDLINGTAMLELNDPLRYRFRSFSDGTFDFFTKVFLKRIEEGSYRNYQSTIVRKVWRVDALCGNTAVVTLNDDDVLELSTIKLESESFAAAIKAAT